MAFGKKHYLFESVFFFYCKMKGLDWDVEYQIVAYDLDQNQRNDYVSSLLWFLTH